MSELHERLKRAHALWELLEAESHDPDSIDMETYANSLDELVELNCRNDIMVKALTGVLDHVTQFEHNTLAQAVVEIIENTFQEGTDAEQAVVQGSVPAGDSSVPSDAQ